MSNAQRPKRPQLWGGRIHSIDEQDAADAHIDALEAENRQQSSDISAMYDVLSRQGRDLAEAVGLLRDARFFMGDLHTGRFGVAVNASYQTGRIDAFLKRMEDTNG